VGHEIALPHIWRRRTNSRPRFLRRYNDRNGPTLVFLEYLDGSLWVGKLE